MPPSAAPPPILHQPSHGLLSSLAFAHGDSLLQISPFQTVPTRTPISVCLLSRNPSPSPPCLRIPGPMKLPVHLPLPARYWTALLAIFTLDYSTAKAVSCPSSLLVKEQQEDYPLSLYLGHRTMPGILIVHDWSTWS